MSVTRRSRPATLWLQILLVGGLACALIVLVQTYRLQRSNWSVVERALRDYSTFAAWSYGQHLSTNLRLSVERSLAVADFLEHAGLPANRICVAGYGEHRPTEQAKDDAARQKNRRVEILMLDR